ncbi:hypothetical protein [Campylobacter upsaliensis]|nr:hypothetical protein [Campylobacter upsaliensis]
MNLLNFHIIVINIIPSQENMPKDVEEVVDYIWYKYGEKDTWYLRT